MKTERRKGFYVYSEGYSIYDYDTETQKYCGSITMQNMTFTYEIYPEEDGEEAYEEIVDWEYDDWIEDTYIEDKWGGREIINLPPNIEPEFTNGLIQIYQGEDFDEAQKAYDEYVQGEVDWNELPNYY